MEAEMNVLLVDGEPDIVENNAEYLGARGYGILKAANGREALALVGEADCVILDVMLPDIDGYTLAPKLCAIKPVPILFLTALQSEEDMEMCFALGTDYLKKPYSLKELLLRIGAMFKNSANATDGIVHLPPLMIDTHRLAVQMGGSELSLTPREYAILMVLSRSPNHAFSHGELFKTLWGDGEVSTHLIQQNVSTLRRKLEEAAPEIRFIKTVHGKGYMLKFPPEVILH